MQMVMRMKEPTEIHQMRITKTTLTSEKLDQLADVLGGQEWLTIRDEEEFLAETGCPPEALEHWLNHHWVECDVDEVLAGRQRICWHAWFLVNNRPGAPTGRLFYPSKSLAHRVVHAESVEQMRPLVLAAGADEYAAQLISILEALTAACAAREYPSNVVDVFWRAYSIPFAVLQELAREGHGPEMDRLQVIIAGFVDVCRRRRDARTPQEKYWEGQVDARWLSGELQKSILSQYPLLVEISRKESSHELAEYVLNEVRLHVDDYLDAIEMMACDGRNPLEVPNPPARVRTALRREQSRTKARERARYAPLTDEQTDDFEDPEALEDRLIFERDLEKAKRTLDLDQDAIRALEAKMDGLNLQGAEASAELNLDPSRLKAARRSLAADRSLARKLRRYLDAYKPKVDDLK
jgi:hypothetical protein